MSKFKLRKAQREDPSKIAKTASYEKHDSNFIPFAGYYNKNTILTKNGELLQVLKITGFNHENISSETLKRIGFTDEELNNIAPARGAGCRECGDSGFKGRCGIYEVLSMTPALEASIQNGGHAAELKDAAQQDGFQTMQDMGRTMIKKQRISVEEFTRVLVLG